MTQKKHTLILSFLLLLVFTGCKSEKKVSTYSSIYKERPVTLYVAPLQDNSQRKEEKYPQDAAFNAERNTAARHLTLTLSHPLAAQGYYVIPTLSAQRIAQQEQQSHKELLEGDLIRYAQHYGVDAVLVVTLHRWKDVDGEVMLFIEYVLRSSKSNTDLMHCWAQAVAKTEYNYKGEAVARHADRVLMQDYGVDAATALRCRLAERVSDHVLRNLPVSARKRQFEQDRYMKANDTYLRCVLTDEDEIEVEHISMEAFEEECFVN